MTLQTLDKYPYYDRIGYIPENIQREVHDSPCRFRVNVQGRRSGKSYAAAREAEPNILTPYSRGWVVAPTYELANKIGREIQANLIDKYGIELRAKKELYGQLYYFKTCLNSEFWIKSADEPKSLLGEGLDWLIIDEAAMLNKIVWERDLRPTLSDRNGWALFTTTPRGYNWIYDLYKRGKNPDFPMWESWRHPSWFSGWFRDDIDELRRTLTAETFNQEYGAEFTTYAGKVFPFTREVHAAFSIPYLREWETYVSIDFGYRMPSVGWYQVGKVEGRPEIHLIDEFSHQEDVTTEALIQAIKQKNESNGYHVQKYFGDPAGKGVQSQSGIGDIEKFANAGITVHYDHTPEHRDIATRIDHARSFVESASGDISFFVDKNCAGHIEDFENYRYPERKVDRNLKDEPLKDGIHDHGCDEFCYFIINRFPIVKREAVQLETDE